MVAFQNEKLPKEFLLIEFVLFFLNYKLSKFPTGLVPNVLEDLFIIFEKISGTRS